MERVYPVFEGWNFAPRKDTPAFYLALMVKVSTVSHKTDQRVQQFLTPVNLPGTFMDCEYKIANSLIIWSDGLFRVFQGKCWIDILRIDWNRVCPGVPADNLLEALRFAFDILLGMPAEIGRYVIAGI